MSLLQFSCDLCNLVLSGQEQYEAHVRGEPHQKRVRGETGTQYTCQLCNVQLSGDQARMTHEFGRLHKNNLAKRNASQSYLSVVPEVAWQAPQQQQAPQREKRGRDDSDATSEKPRRSRLDAVVSRLRDLATAIERREHGDSPSITVTVVAQRGTRAAQNGSRFKLTVDEVYSGSDAESID
jgi:hypothetical protein